MPARSARSKAAAPAEPEEIDEFEELEDDEATDEDLEELEEDDEPEEAPKPKGRKATKSAAAPAKAEAPKFGSAQLAAYVTEQTGETFDARSIRMLLRKLAKDGKLDRQVGETRERYSFSGPNDAIVKQVVAMVKDGTAKAMKQEGLAKLKEAGEAKKAAKAKAKQAEVEDEDVEEEEEEAPKPSTRRAAKAAPAKATPAKTTRRRASASAE